MTGGRESITGQAERLRDLLSKSCVPDMEGRPGAPSDPPPFPCTDRHLPQLKAAGPRPPGTMGRGFLQGLPQGGRQGQAGQRKAGTPPPGTRGWQGHGGPGPQLLTHCLSQGQVTSAGTFVSQGRSHATPTLKGSEEMPRGREKEGRRRAGRGILPGKTWCLSLRKFPVHRALGPSEHLGLTFPTP